MSAKYLAWAFDQRGLKPQTKLLLIHFADNTFDGVIDLGPKKGPTKIADNARLFTGLNSQQLHTELNRLIYLGLMSCLVGYFYKLNITGGKQ